jgi:hypothetical protein
MFKDTKEWLESFVTVDELVKTTGEPEWLLEEVLLPNTTAILYGKEGKGKSRLMYQLAHSIQTGDPFFGIKVCKTGPVLMLQADMSPEQNAIAGEWAMKVGLKTDEIYTPGEYGFINVLEADGKQALEVLADQIEPVLVIVDTATDVYDEPGQDGPSLNDVVKRVVRTFRKAFPGAAILFVLHERKKSQYLQAKGGTDTDAALGGGEWTRKASGVFRLVEINEYFAELYLEKARGVKPWECIKLRRGEGGFFHTDLGNIKDVRQALAVWPQLIGVDPEEAKKVTSISGVCRSISEASNGALKVDALRKAYQRAVDRNTRFAWLDIIKEQAGTE